jgi:hypothetical protein
LIVYQIKPIVFEEIFNLTRNTSFSGELLNKDKGLLNRVGLKYITVLKIITMKPEIPDEGGNLIEIQSLFCFHENKSIRVKISDRF